MTQRTPERIRKLTARLLEGPGQTQAALRQQIAGRNRSLSPVSLPGSLEEYVDKVHHHAYRITDADVASLREVGYTEEAIFELTLSAALGAALLRVERGLALLEEEENR